MQTKPRKSPNRGALVLTAPWVELASECACRFFLSAVLAAGQILEGYSPFALGYVAASGPGAGGFFALLGACLGYLLTKPMADAFRYLATAILVYAVAFAFFDLKLYTTRYFMPSCAAFMGALTGFVYLAEQGWATASVICFATEIGLIFCAARFFTIATLDKASSSQQRMAALFTLGAVAVSLQAVPLPFSLHLGAVFAGAVILWAGNFLDHFSTTAAALALGLCLDLSAGGGAVYAAAFGLGGLLCAAGAKWGRPLGVLSFLAGNLSVTLWSFAVTKSFLPFWNGVLGCCLYLAVPLSTLEKLRKRLPAELTAPPVETPVKAAAPEEIPLTGIDALQDRLRRQGAAFRALHDQLSSDLTAMPEPKTDGFALFQRCAQRVCQGCVFRTTCWTREVSATEKSLRPAVDGMEKRGRSDPADFPAGFAARCSRLNELVNGVNQEYTAELTRRRYHLRLLEARRALCRQYERIARFLGESALSLEPKAVPAMSAPTLSALAGVAAGKRPGQSVSGDAGGWFRDDEGVLWVVLCDGMGSGADAARDSRFAYKLLEQFLSAGIGPEVALATVCGALGLRWECTGSFTTIDLLQLDLHTGEGAVYKLGAAPTYLRRDGVLSRITSSTLPAGLQQGSVPDVSRFRLRPGDLAVLVSDGVTDGSEDGWVREQIRAFQGDSPKDLAGALLTHDNPATDDRTAIVLLIEGTQV